jgi:hypothetical protein
MIEMDRDITFAMALPVEWQGLDLLGDAGRELLQAPLAGALLAAARGGSHAELLMLRSLIARAPSGRPLSAGLAVTIADMTTPLAAEPLEADSFAGKEVSAVTVKAGSGLRVRHVSPARALDAEEPYDVLHVQYLLHTALGLLTITFTTLQAPDAPEWEQFFDGLAATAELA